MLHIIFWEPEIPGNTGAAIRLSACTGSMLHLVKPLGFDMDDAKLRRAGLDYHDLAHVMVHESLDDALAQVPGRVWALTGHASAMYSDVSSRRETYSHPHARGRALTQLGQFSIDRPVRGVASAGLPGRRLAAGRRETADRNEARVGLLRRAS